MHLLAGDIGGTKTVLGLFSSAEGPHDALAVETFPSQDYPSLEKMAQNFLGRLNLQVGRACFGIAGPIFEGRSEVTNLPWVIDASDLASFLNVDQVCLINDLEAVANAVPILDGDDQEIIITGEVDPTGPIGILAPGTGLGEGFLTWSESGYKAHASEGGHVDFAPTNEDEMGLLAFLFQRYRHVSYERVCSGLGIPNIYAYYKETGFAPESQSLAAQLAQVEDQTPVIVTAALDPVNPDPLCRKTFETFLSILGAEAGNLALKILTTGGIYLGGGIPPRILGSLKGNIFKESFHRKGRFADFIAGVQVSVILNKQAALIGAANYGLNNL